MELTEIWKPINGYEGIYEVSNFGRIKSLERLDCRGYRVHGRIKRQKDDKGYLNVDLCRDGYHRTFQVHRLVALAFIDNPKNLPQVNHLDENKKNNRANNLEFCTPSENIRYGTCRDRASAHRKHSKMKPVVQFLNGEIVKIYRSGSEAAKKTGFNVSHIYKCCSSKYAVRSVHGYQFAYAEPYRSNIERALEVI